MDAGVRVDASLDVEATDDLRSLYDAYPAWADRTVEEIREIIENSDVVVGLWDTSLETDQLVASARVLTDFVRYGMIYEVIVAEDRRGEGLGERVLGTVVTHPKLQDIHLALHCREELVPFYERCGFRLNDRDVEFPDGEAITYRTMAYDGE